MDNTGSKETNVLWEKARAAGMPRRRFLALLAGSGAAAVLAACTPKTTPSATPTPTATSAPSPKPTTTAAPTASASPSPTAKAQTIEWRATDYRADSHITWAETNYAFNRIQDLTGGLVKLTNYPVGKICSAPEQLDYLNKGLVDVVVTSTAQHSGTVPALGLPDVPGIVTDTFVAAKLMKRTKEYNDFMNAAFAAKGINNVQYVAAGYASMHCLVSRDKPIRVPADIKGKIVRALSPDDAAYFKAAGATPQVMATSEVYERLQKGMVDATNFSATSSYQWKLQEVAKYFTLGIPNNPTMVCIWVNKNSLNKLPSSAQAAVLSMLEYAMYRYSLIMMAQETIVSTTILPPLLAARGGGIVTLNPDEQKQWVDLSKSVVNEFTAKGKVEADVTKWVGTFISPTSA